MEIASGFSRQIPKSTEYPTIPVYERETKSSVLVNATLTIRVDKMVPP
jgi:hypothetical protein